jgi:hypothetical protein
MTAPPLTHHEILGLVEPFARRGRHVDLAATDRIERRIVFKPIDHAGDADAEPALRETLQLESDDDRNWRLTRVLARPDGLQATLLATGPRPAELLAHVEAIALQHQFRSGPGYVMARSYEFEPPATGSAQAEAAAARLILSRGEVRLDGLVLTMTVRAIRKVAAEIELAAMPGTALDLPEDLLAVIGWDWARLVRQRVGWKSRLRLRGPAARRSRQAETALEQVASHLVRVLAEPPSQFHQRQWLARWGVVFRRGIPTLTALGLIAAAISVPRFSSGLAAGVAVSLHYVSIGVLALSFCLQELPQFEIPPWPRRSRAPTWRLPAAPEGTAAPAS